jgi:hypothetical protein
MAMIHRYDGRCRAEAVVRSDITLRSLHDLLKSLGEARALGYRVVTPARFVVLVEWPEPVSEARAGDWLSLMDVLLQ